MLIFRDNAFRIHDTGPDHPERVGRLVAVDDAIHRYVAQTGKESASRAMVSVETGAGPVALAALTAVHDDEMVRIARESVEGGSGFIDADTAVSSGSFAAALAAAGTAVRAVDAVLASRTKRAFCALRPPGHHANRFASSGFCLFNNVAIAARHAQLAYGVERVLIVDWDVHHGNGTQDIFYDDPSVFFFSIHRSPFYPGSGSAGETGAGRGLGTTLNVPVAYGTSRKAYLERFRAGLESAAEKFRPELVLISAGFDAHRDDPIGSLDLETEDFAEMTRDVVELAEQHSGGRIISCLEGGYNLKALGLSVEAHLGALHEL